MPFQSCPDIAEVVIHLSHLGQEIVNVLHAEKVGGYSQADVDNLADAADAWVGAHLLALLSADTTYAITSVRGLTSIVDKASFSVGHTGPGTHTGNSNPANVAFCLTLRTGNTGRSARGRIYQGPVPQTELGADNNHVTSTFATNSAAAWFDLESAIIAASWQGVVLSRRTAGALRPVGVGFPIISVEARNNALDSQRGRLGKGH